MEKAFTPIMSPKILRSRTGVFPQNRPLPAVRPNGMTQAGFTEAAVRACRSKNHSQSGYSGMIATIER